MIYFTSDLHLSHKKVLEDRKEFTEVETMNEFLINEINWNVSEKDELYILGDIYFGNFDISENWLSKINCKHIYCILGNHDDKRKIEKLKRKDTGKNIFAWVKEYYEFGYEKKHFVLFHYPIEEWHWKHGGSIHLHGHCHGKLENSKNRMDVGVDALKYKPISIQEVLDKYR